jgi:Bacterial PH domain
LGVLILLIIFSALFIAYSVPAAISVFIDGLLSLAFLGAVLYFVLKDLSLWWFNIDLITNKRIISCRGFMTSVRKVIPLDKIVQISVDQGSPRNVFLAYGDVHVYQVGSQHIMRNVPRPRNVRDALQGVFEGFKTRKPPAEPLPRVRDPQMREVIEKLGKRETMPKLPDADDRYEHLRNPAKLRGPLRRFGGPLRLPAEVHYTADEHTVMYIQRTKWLLIARLIGPAAGLLTALVLLFIFPSFAIVLLGLMLILLIVGVLLTINYVDDVFILTNKRIIDIERKYIFLYEVHEEAEYKNIRESKVRLRNIFHTMFDVGDVIVETPGSQPNIHITTVDHPFFILDKINEVKGFKEKFDRAKNKNDRQEELVKWFSNVASVLERRMASRGVPDLHKMDLLAAAEIVAKMGMKVVPIGEDDTFPDMEPGLIVKQNPLPGTLMSLDPDVAGRKPEIQVTLSKRG